MKNAFSALLFFAPMASLAQVSVFRNEHVDLTTSFTVGTPPSVAVRDDGSAALIPGPQAMLVLGANTKRTRTSTDGFGFIGVNPGENYWRMPQGQVAQVLFLGLAAYGVSSGSIDTYDPTTESAGRVTTIGPWVRFQLHQVTGPGLISTWQTAVGGPKVFFNSTDGLSATDSLWLLAGGHSHFNWAFTQTGCYDLQVRSNVFLNDGNSATLGALTPGDVYPVHFGIEVDPAPVAGELTLQSFEGDLSTRTMRLQIRKSGTVVDERSQPIMTTTGWAPNRGRFAMTTGERGNLEVILKPRTGLSKVISVGAFDQNGLLNQNLSFVNGDINGDDSVDLLDYFDLSDSYNTSQGDPTFLEFADLNGDLSIDLLDYFILSDSYNLTGQA